MKFVSKPKRKRQYIFSAHEKWTKYIEKTLENPFKGLVAAISLNPSKIFKPRV